MGCDTLRRWAMGGSMRSTSATKSDADVKLEAVYLFPNISPCSAVRSLYSSTHLTLARSPGPRRAPLQSPDETFTIVVVVSWDTSLVACAPSSPR
jgi:hypothetical protein